MYSKYKHNKRGYYKKQSVTARIVKTALFIALAFVSVRIGMAAGNVLYSFDGRFVQSVDTETFKATLNRSFPIIDTVYNSGKMSISFSGELKSLIKSVFHFDLRSPVTILNAQSSYLYSYYNHVYGPYIASQDSERGLDSDSMERSGGTEPDSAGTPAKVADPAPNNQSQYKEDASSLYYEGDESDKSSNKNIEWSGKYAVQNQTKLKIDYASLAKEPLKLDFSKTGPKVLIFHTHTTESFLMDLNKKNTPNWTTDPRYNVVRIGEELKQNLEKKYGINVMHNGTVHDYPNYNSSYTNSLKTVQSILKGNPSIKIVLDIHRDGLGSNQPKLRSVTNVAGKSTAKIMFVVGSDQTNGLSHPRWKENLKLAMKLYENLSKQNSGITRQILISKYRYNQHLSNGALIIEIGGDGNTLSEALESTKYLAKAINDVIRSK